MKALLALCVLLIPSAWASGQTETSYAMTSKENLEWLAMLKDADEDLGWELVKDRLIQRAHELDPNNNLDVPVLIIDGVPIENHISKRRKQFLVTQLTAERVKITIVDKAPEGLYINKAFTGIVLMTITDKTMSKKFRKLK